MTRKRPIIELKKLFCKTSAACEEQLYPSSKRNKRLEGDQQIHNNDRNRNEGITQGINATSLPPKVYAISTSGLLPVLYDWKQKPDGFIIGKVKGSPWFDDGATISTSAVPHIANDGTIVTTSRPYLIQATSLADPRGKVL